jgi:hypothetical protein
MILVSRFTLTGGALVAARRLGSEVPRFVRIVFQGAHPASWLWGRFGVCRACFGELSYEVEEANVRR